MRAGSTDEADRDALVAACVAEVSDSRLVATAGQLLTTITFTETPRSATSAGRATGVETA